jgi:ketosteroid isomerase-like protein
MKSLIWGAALALTVPAAALAAEPAPAATPAAAPAAKVGPSDHARLVAQEKAFAAAFTAKDVNKIMTFYARKGLFVFDVVPPRQYVGWEAYKKDFEDLFKGMPGPIKFDVSDLAITVSGDVAYGHSIQTVTQEGGPPPLVVRVTDVWRKSGDRWLIVQEHVSVPVDVTTGKADLSSKP